jgi:hypothetical protein
MKLDLTILVSSTDAYADCYEPFFRLFARYWPGLTAPVVLITEEKNYVCPYRDVTVFRTAEGHGSRQPTWGWNLRRCLESLDTELVLYLGVDSFLTAPVDDGIIEEFAGYMTETSWTHEFTMHIGLCPRSSHGPLHLTEYPLLWEVDRQARYRFSLVPGLWNRKDFLRYVRASDNPWQFEESSHIRARRTPKRVLTVNRHVFRPDGKLIYPFSAPAGGLIRGKWDRGSVVGLFEQHGIKVDFSQRGFADEAAAKEPAPLTFGVRVRDALRRRRLRLIGAINEAIDRFRY